MSQNGRLSQRWCISTKLKHWAWQCCWPISTSVISRFALQSALQTFVPPSDQISWHLRSLVSN